MLRQTQNPVNTLDLQRATSRKKGYGEFLRGQNQIKKAFAVLIKGKEGLLSSNILYYNYGIRSEVKHWNYLAWLAEHSQY